MSMSKNEESKEAVKKRIIIGVVVSLVIVIGIALVWYFGIKAPRDKAYKDYKKAVDTYNQSVLAYNEATVSFNAIADDMAKVNEDCKTVLEDAKAVLNNGEKPYEEEKKDELKAIIESAEKEIVPVPDLYSTKEEMAANKSLAMADANKIKVQTKIVYEERISLDEETQVVIGEASKLEIPDYSKTVAKIEESESTLLKSYALMNQITNPSEEFVLERLALVSDIANTVPVTEDNDPNGKLGKAGGYTSQIYFSTPLLKTESLLGDRLIDAGTIAGGSIEVYATEEDANKRDIYLASFDGTVLDSGKHVVLGTMVIRVSSDLTASKQNELSEAIVEVMLMME